VSPSSPVVVLVALLLAVATACAGSGASRKPSALEDEVTVTGDFGARPTITIAAPLEVGSSHSWTPVVGTGPRIRSGSSTILQLTIADARTGRTVVSTHDAGQRPLEAGLTDQLFPSLVTALTEARAGSRVVVASTAADTYGDQGAPQLGIKAGDSVVLVADVLSADPTSLEASPTATEDPKHPGLSSSLLSSRLELEDGKPSGFDFAGLRKPVKQQSFVLQQGKGPAIDGPKRIVADYLGDVWGAAKPFHTSYAGKPAKFSIGIGRAVPCWDKGLDGVRAGSRVLLVCPPASAYGRTAQPGIPARSTLVFLVDVLGVG
jgi:peptidylprolyl isomerase